MLCPRTSLIDPSICLHFSFVVVITMSVEMITEIMGVVVRSRGSRHGGRGRMGHRAQKSKDLRTSGLLHSLCFQSGVPQYTAGFQLLHGDSAEYLHPDRYCGLFGGARSWHVALRVAAESWYGAAERGWGSGY